ncbi:DUF3306 domain-containing protein [Halomonas sp. LBP4]|uniref:DUF3306 domain-containing protein n=1 Tax=Halomonas sp. LBP4 TaxID=2044917 RepID=UPI000D76CF2F|nr:DUF3306 domain-containing protein [Halomonas sp. LBP4]PXX95338.1 hypothetical protein CR157_19055 [Halomonas sp. LBP4]
MNRLSRWSRRKLGEQTEDVELPEPAATTVEPAPESPGADTRPPEPGSLDDSLPDPDTLPAGSDFTAFMQRGVSDGLRRRALRRMFSGERYGIRDGLDDYDDDYRERLKPLASELAQRLRQWTRQLDESELEPAVADPAGEAEIAEGEEQREAMPAPDEDTVDARRVVAASAETGTPPAKGED